MRCPAGSNHTSSLRPFAAAIVCAIVGVADVTTLHLQRQALCAGGNVPLLHQLLGVSSGGARADEHSIPAAFKGMQCIVASTSKSAGESVRRFGVHDSGLLRGAACECAALRASAVAPRLWLCPFADVALRAPQSALCSMNCLLWKWEVRSGAVHLCAGHVLQRRI